MTHPLTREEQLYEERIQKARGEKNRACVYIQELLSDHPEVPVSVGSYNTKLGWKIVSSLDKCPMDNVVLYRDNCIAILGTVHNDIVPVIVLTSELKAKERLCLSEYQVKELRKKPFLDTNRYTAISKSGEKLRNFNGVWHYICLSTKGGFINIFDLNLETEEEKRYLFRLDVIEVDDYYLEPDVNPKCVVEIKSEIYYLHYHDRHVDIYHCQSGKKFTSLYVGGKLQKAFSFGNYIIVDCFHYITSIKCEEIQE